MTTQLIIAYTQIKKIWRHGFNIYNDTHICVKWLLIVSYLQCTQAKRLVEVNSKVTAVHIVFQKLYLAALHVDTVSNTYDCLFIQILSTRLIIFFKFTMLWNIFHLILEKQNWISGMTNVVYKLPWNYEILKKSHTRAETVPSISFRN